MLLCLFGEGVFIFIFIFIFIFKVSGERDGCLDVWTLHVWCGVRLAIVRLIDDRQ